MIIRLLQLLLLRTSINQTDSNPCICRLRTRLRHSTANLYLNTLYAVFVHRETALEKLTSGMRNALRVVQLLLNYEEMIDENLDEYAIQLSFHLSPDVVPFMLTTGGARCVI